MDQKKIIIIGSVGVLVAGMLVIGALVYRNRTAVETPPPEGQQTTTVPPPTGGGKTTTGGIGTPLTGGAKTPTGSATSPPAGLPGGKDQTPDYTGSLDSDHDGLPDAREKVLGTDPHKADTDGDGFSDGEEVLKYGSDPLDPKSTPKTIEGHEKFGL